MDNTATTGDSAFIASSLSDTVAQDDSEIPSAVAFSEPELRSSTPVMSFGENWYLRERPQYNHRRESGGGQRRVFNSLEGYELEISQDSGRQTVSRLQRMLQETNDRLERLQSEVQQVSHRSEEDEAEDENSDDDDDEEPPFSMWKPKTPEDSEDDTDQENSDDDDDE